MPPPTTRVKPTANSRSHHPLAILSHYYFIRSIPSAAATADAIDGTDATATAAAAAAAAASVAAPGGY